MGYTRKTIEEMNCLDDFFMNAVAEDPEVGEAFCKRLLSVLLQRRIGKIRVRAQYALQGESPDRRGIRLDVEVEELTDGEETRIERIYDVEPHLQNDLNLMRHNRFYQARLDAKQMRRGERDFTMLPDLYVITILNFDPFGYDRMMYTVRNRCIEEEELEYRDGLQFIYFYTGGKRGGSEEIRTLLRYLQRSRAENAVSDATRELHDYVSRVKTKPEVKDRIMDFEEYVWLLEKRVEKETAERVEKETAERVEKETAERVEKETTERVKKETAERVERETAIECILEFLEEYGEVPEALRQELAQTTDIRLLKKYRKLAAKAGSIQEFLKGKETV